MLYSVETNGINNSPIPRSDLWIPIDTMGPRKYKDQENTTVKKSGLANITFHTVCAPKNIFQFNNVAALSVDEMHLSCIFLLISLNECVVEAHRR